MTGNYCQRLELENEILKRENDRLRSKLLALESLIIELDSKCMFNPAGQEIQNMINPYLLEIESAP
jgi:hypothetical protein